MAKKVRRAKTRPPRHSLKSPIESPIVSEQTVRVTWVSAGLGLAVAALLFGWAFAVYTVAYDVRDAAGLAVLAHDRQFYGDIFTVLPRNLSSLFPDFLLLVTALGPGRLVLDRLRLSWHDAFEYNFFSLILGLCLYTFAILGVGSLRLLHAHVVLLLFVVGALATAYSIGMTGRGLRFAISRSSMFFPAKRPLVTRRRLAGVMLTVAVVFYLYIALLGALSPETQFDSRIYHLGVAKHFADRGAIYDIVRETGLARAGWPAYQQIDYAGLIALSGVVSAKLLQWVDAVLVVVFLIYFCRTHFGDLLLGVVAALIFVATPIVTWSSATGANDVTMALFTLLLLHTLLRWRSDPSSMRWLVLAGAIAGYSLGVKWTGLSAVAVCGVLAVATFYTDGRHHSLPMMTTLSLLVSASAHFLGGVLLFVLPSLIHAYVLTGNPIFPLLYTIFHSPYWNFRVDAVQRASFRMFGEDYSPGGFLTLPWTAVTQSDRYKAVIGPLYLVSLPAVSAALTIVGGRSGRMFRLIGAFVALWLIVWFASDTLTTRYLVTIFPVWSVVIAYLLIAWRSKHQLFRLVRLTLWIIVIPMVVLGNQLLAPLQTGANVPGVAARENIPWEYLYQGQNEYYVQMAFVPMLSYINRHLSACRDKVYDGADLILYYVYSDVELLNGSQYDGPTGLGEWNLSSPDALRRLADAGITHVDVYTRGIITINPALRAHLVQQHVDRASGETLFRVSYPRNLVRHRTAGCA